MLRSRKSHEAEADTVDTVTVIAMQPDHAVLLLQRNPDAYPGTDYVDPFPYVWELIGGHMKSQEDPGAAALREIAEETGIVLAPSNVELAETSSFMSQREPATNWIFVASVEYDLQLGVSQEHLASMWLPLAEVQRMQLAFKHSKIVNSDSVLHKISGLGQGNCGAVTSAATTEQSYGYRYHKYEVEAGMLECGKCHRSKRVNQFHRNRQSHTGYHSWCKECRKA